MQTLIQVAWRRGGVTGMPDDIPAPSKHVQLLNPNEPNWADIIFWLFREQTICISGTSLLKHIPATI